MQRRLGGAPLMLAALFVSVLGGGYWWRAHTSVPASIVSEQETVPTTTNAATSTPAPAPEPSEPMFTAAQVAQHASAQSCYTSINGSVYDLTSWIGQHPGGPEAILSLCGTDGTAAFEAQHGGQRRPNNELASLKIGVLAQ